MCVRVCVCMSGRAGVVVLQPLLGVQVVHLRVHSHLRPQLPAMYVSLFASFGAHDTSRGKESKLKGCRWGVLRL